jgi:ATP-binding cassette subfamily F protein uup
VLPTIEDIRRVTRTVTGKDVSASSMLEQFGFTGDKLTARLGDLSGGERRRFQLLKLLLTEPNVLLLDEPTNDLDIDTLNVVEDFLDRWPGTLVVVSHDRYFLERVTDSIWALMGDGQISMLPNGVDQYLEHRKTQQPAPTARDRQRATRQPTGQSSPEERSGGGRSARSDQLQDFASQEVTGNQRKADQRKKAKVGGAQERAARKTVARIDKQLKRIEAREAQLTEEMTTNAADHDKLAALSAELRGLSKEKAELEAEWLEAAALLE